MIYLGNTDLFDNSELETLLKQVEQLKLLKEKYGLDYKPTKKKKKKKKSASDVTYKKWVSALN